MIAPDPDISYGAADWPLDAESQPDGFYPGWDGTLLADLYDQPERDPADGFRSFEPFACDCGHDIGAHGMPGTAHPGCFAGCACAAFHRTSPAARASNRAGWSASLQGRTFRRRLARPRHV